MRPALHQCKPSATMTMSRSVIVACPSQLGDLVSHLGRASGQVPRDLLHWHLARKHVTKVNEIHLGPAGPGISRNRSHCRPQSDTSRRERQRPDGDAPRASARRALAAENAPQKADGQWLYLNFHCQSNTPVAHHFDNQLGLQSKHSARGIGAYQRHRNKRNG